MDLIKIQIIDKNGIIVYEKEYTGNIRSTTIDLSHLKSDDYLLRLDTKSHVEMHKIAMG